ncbi:MAG TPA: hypothetical protein PLD59_14490, partial [Tepidisphaeraceae bacterium]|nr:hypothetical protein [Tepidisphaeraceae bacterium]
MAEIGREQREVVQIYHAVVIKIALGPDAVAAEVGGKRREVVEVGPSREIGVADDGISHENAGIVDRLPAECCRAAERRGLGVTDRRLHPRPGGSGGGGVAGGSRPAPRA